MKQISTSVDIEAAASIVWGMIADLDRYPEWNPFVIKASGALDAGRRISVTLAPPGGRAMRIRPRLLAVTPERELRWRGSLLVPGLFDGEHVFRLESTRTGVRLHHFETFSGALVPVLWRLIEAPTRAGFEAMNRALKARAEAASMRTARSAA